MVGGLSTWHLVVIVVGAVIILFLLLICSYFCNSSSKSTVKERKRYVYKYDPMSGKGNVAVIMEMSTSNGGIITVEQPEHPTNVTTDFLDFATHKDPCVERPRSQSFSETRYVYRYNPASGEGSVERIPAQDTLIAKRPKSSRSHNCLAVELLENQLHKKIEHTDRVPFHSKITRKFHKGSDCKRLGSDPKGINEVGKNGHDKKAAMETRSVGKKGLTQGVHHVLLTPGGTKPPHGQLRHNHRNSKTSSHPTTQEAELSRSTSELLSLEYDSNGRDAGKRQRDHVCRTRSSVGEIFPSSRHRGGDDNRRKNSGRLGLLAHAYDNRYRMSEGHIYKPQRKQSDSPSISVDGDENASCHTLSLTSLTQTMWQKEYETDAPTSDAYIPEINELPEIPDTEDIFDDDQISSVTHADVHSVTPPLSDLNSYRVTREHPDHDPPSYHILYS